LALGALTWIVAGASVQLMHLCPAGAAEECIAGPNKESPAGHHWYYRVDRSTKRHCWYLGERGRAVSHTATSSKRAALFAKLRRENSPDHHTDDARAELTQKAVENTLRAEDTLLTTSTDRKRLVAARSTQDLPGVATGQDLESLIAGRWPNFASVLLPPSGLTNVSLASALAKPDANVRDPTDPVTGAPPAPIYTADVPTASRADTPPVRRASSAYSLFWAFCGALVLVSLAGGATYFMTRAGATEAGWSPQPFDVARMTSWLDHATDMSTRVFGSGQKTVAPRHDWFGRRSVT
jgi:hypothetical protein